MDLEIILLIINRIKKWDINNLKNYISDNWAKNHILTQHNELLNWQYKFKEHYNFIIAKENDKIIGFQGYIPLNQYDYNLNNKEIFLAMWMAKEKNSIGLGMKINNRLIELTNPNFIGVLGINQNLLKFHKWQKYEVGEMNHHLMISNNIKNYKILGGYKKEFAQIKLEQNNTSFILIKNDTDFKIIKGDIFEHQHPKKSIEYLKNRYFFHPIYNYSIYAIFNNGEIKCLLVVRVISVEGSKVIRIVDYIGSSSDFIFLNNLLNYLLDYYSAEYIDIYSFGIDDSIIRKTGLINKFFYKSLIVPNYFEPFVKENIKINYAFKTNYDNNKIRLFKGDGDQDRPSFLREKCIT